MDKSAWDYTLEFISIATDIDTFNEKLGKTNNPREREIISAKVDSLESKLFEIRNKLKNLNI